jgi:drug/metabolite transporter (DMT)-like permease
MQRLVTDAATLTSGPQPPLRLGAVEWALIFLHSMMWGSAYFFGALALRDLPPLTITAYRLIPACIIVVGVCLLAGYRIPRTLDYWRRMFFLGLVNNMVPMALILWAQHQVSGGIAAVFNATAPLFGVILAHFLTADEKLHAGKIVGILTGVAGVAVLVGVDVATGLGGGGTTGSVFAKAALLAAAACYAIASVVARTSSHEPPFVIASGQMLSAFVVAMPLALIVDRPWLLPTPSLTAIGGVIGMGVCGSAFAAMLYFTVLRRAGATNTLLVTLLLPLTPILLGAAFLDDTLAPREIAGAAIIGLALLVLDGRLFKRARPGSKAPHRDMT